MKAKADLVQGWLQKARSDALAMNASRQAGALDAACFHAQQAVEKCLKAYLIHHEVEFPFTHNLARLVELASRKDEAFGSLIDQVEPLTPYAVELRYDDAFWPLEAVARDAAATAESVMDFILARLPDEITAEQQNRSGPTNE